MKYGAREAVNGLSLQVQPGTCHALFGRNGAGKTSTLRALLGLIRPDAGSVKLFGLELARHEAEVKERLAWVPDAPGFHPWMTVREALDYARSLRTRWSPELEAQLLERFELDLRAPTSALSKGQKTQLALACAISADPDLLVLDEPTSGLDPLVRRTFLQAVIGVFQERAPTRKTILVSTHLISEFEGIVDSFTVVSQGRAALTSTADEARARFCRVRAWFDHEAPAAVPLKTIKPVRREGRMLELFLDAPLDEGRGWLTAHGASRVDEAPLSLEDIFLLSAATTP